MRAENRSNLEQICVKLNLVLNEAHIYGECWYKIPPSSGLGEKNYRPVFRPGNNPSDHRVIANESVTCDQAEIIGSAIQISLNGKSLVDAKILRSRQVLTLAAQSKESINDVIRINADACIYCNCFGSLWDIAVCGENVIVVSNDTDVKIMLLYLYNSEMGDIIVKPFGSKKSGCDATYAIFDQGKTSIIKLVENSKKARNFCDISMSSDSTVKEVGDPGIGLLVLMYSGRENDTLSHLRFVNYMRMTATSKKQLQPEKLPPTKRAAWFHNLRVYHQICHWKSLKGEKDPLEWGWKM
ncbi:hypothetical protein GQR58_013964 [Nymphon striatum]|nr:hypothetical protein GQR58_013964 [Nymphon striatum]